MDISELETFLVPLKHRLVWDFLLKKDNYDWALCDILWMHEDTWRYWDAEWNGYKIEFKKWKSIWLDLVRYSEIVLWINENARTKTITLFFIPNKDRSCISKIYWIETDKLIQKLKLNKSIADRLFELHKNMPRSLNAQASLTVKDIREIADFEV